MWVTKLLISPVKKKDFLPKNDQIWPKIGIFGQFGPGHAGLFSALLVGWLVVVARGLYLARHLFTLVYILNNGQIFLSPGNFSRYCFPKLLLSSNASASDVLLCQVPPVDYL